MSLLNDLSNLVGAAFEQEGLDRSLGKVKPSDRPDLAQFQCNGALIAAKAKKENPRALAERIKAHLEKHHEFDKIDLAGPGFINMSLTDQALSARLNSWTVATAMAAVRDGTGENIVMDYGGPNVAKPLHVGHLRAAIIGESLKRLFRATGDTVVGDVHLGDWGLPMGQLITEVQQEQPDLVYFDPTFSGDFPDTSPVTLVDLERLYPQASAACKADERRAAAARQATAELQSGRRGYRALWQHFVAVSTDAIRKEYADLGVTFDLWKGEADADPYIAQMIEDFRAKGLTETDDGAEIVRVSRADDKKDIPPLILLKSDGSVLYGTTDLATIVDRRRTISPDRIIYVVDQRQSLHFVQVYRAAGLAGLFDEEKLEHIGFGTINGKDGKPYKTRDGGALRLRALIDQTVEKARERMQASGVAKDLDDAERGEIARKIAIAALKFADLSNPRMSDYVFDLDRFVAFEGKTGPYLLYASVRVGAVLRRANEDGGEISISTMEERQLVLKLLAFEDALRTAKQRRMPHFMCDHIYDIAQNFSKFYAASRIVDETDDRLRKSRISLVTVVGSQLSSIFDLLGFDAPARM